MFFKRMISGLQTGGRRWLPGRWIRETPQDRNRYAQTGGYTPERMAALMRQASTGDISDLCIASREIRSRNWDILHALQTRTSALSGSGWTVEPGDETPAAKEAAEALERELRDAGGNGDGTFADLVAWLQLAVVDPFAAAEIIWSPTGGISGFRSIGAWHFTLRDGFTPRLVTEDTPNGMDLPPDKVIIHRLGGGNDPASGGLIRCLAWLHVFQNYPVKDLLSFVERYGMPFVVAKVDNGTFEQDRWTLRTLIRSFGPNGGGIINRSTELELLQAANTGGDVYFRLLEYTGQAITKVLLGQLASSSEATGLSGGDAQSAVRQDLLDSDARALESTLRSGLVASWMRFRYASPVPAPRIHFCTEQPEDIQALAQTLSTLSAAGLEAADIDEISARIGVKLQRKPEQAQTFGFGMAAPPSAPENADNIDTLNLKQKYDAMGVAIRAGLLTATPEIEEQTRTELGLPAMTPEVRKAWEATGGIRQPITLKSKEADAVNDALNIDEDEDKNGVGLSARGAADAPPAETLPDALEAWLGPVADAVSDLDDDDLTDEQFAERLKHCGELKFGPSAHSKSSKQPIWRPPMKLQIKLENADALREAVDGLTGEEFAELWAEAAMRLAKKNAEKAAGNGFGRSVVAGGVRAETFPGRAEITTEYIGAHVHLGGPIASRNGKDLAIPLDTEASRKYNPRRLFARELDQIKLFAVLTKSGKKLLFRQREKGEKSEEGPLFVMLRQTRPQKARPWWPTEAEADEATEQLLKTYLG